MIYNIKMAAFADVFTKFLIVFIYLTLFHESNGSSNYLWRLKFERKHWPRPKRSYSQDPSQNFPWNQFPPSHSQRLSPTSYSSGYHSPRFSWKPLPSNPREDQSYLSRNRSPDFLQSPPRHYGSGSLAKYKCSPRLCNYNGNCMKSFSWFYCDCLEGYSGRTCQTNTRIANRNEEIDEILTDIRTAFRGILIFLLIVMIIGLYYHSRRVYRRMKKFKDVYSETVQSGILPSVTPPDWCEVSQMICMEMCCCQKLETDDIATLEFRKAKQPVNIRRKIIEKYYIRQNEFDDPGQKDSSPRYYNVASDTITSVRAAKLSAPKKKNVSPKLKNLVSTFDDLYTKKPINKPMKGGTKRKSVKIANNDEDNQSMDDCSQNAADKEMPQFSTEVIQTNISFTNAGKENILKSLWHGGERMISIKENSDNISEKIIPVLKPHTDIDSLQGKTNSPKLQQTTKCLTVLENDAHHSKYDVVCTSTPVHGTDKYRTAYRNGRKYSYVPFSETSNSDNIDKAVINGHECDGNNSTCVKRLNLINISDRHRSVDSESNQPNLNANAPVYQCLVNQHSISKSENSKHNCICLETNDGENCHSNEDTNTVLDCDYRIELGATSGMPVDKTETGDEYLVTEWLGDYTSVTDLHEQVSGDIIEKSDPGLQEERYPHKLDIADSLGDFGGSKCELHGDDTVSAKTTLVTGIEPNRSPNPPGLKHSDTDNMLSMDDETVCFGCDLEGPVERSNLVSPEKCHVSSSCSNDSFLESLFSEAICDLKRMGISSLQERNFDMRGLTESGHVSEPCEEEVMPNVQVAGRAVGNHDDEANIATEEFRLGMIGVTSDGDHRMNEGSVSDRFEMTRVAQNSEYTQLHATAEKHSVTAEFIKITTKDCGGILKEDHAPDRSDRTITNRTQEEFTTTNVSEVPDCNSVKMGAFNVTAMDGNVGVPECFIPENTLINRAEEGTILAEVADTIDGYKATADGITTMGNCGLVTVTQVDIIDNRIDRKKADNETKVDMVSEWDSAIEHKINATTKVNFVNTKEDSVLLSVNMAGTEWQGEESKVVFATAGDYLRVDEDNSETTDESVNMTKDGLSSNLLNRLEDTDVSTKQAFDVTDDDVMLENVNFATKDYCNNQDGVRESKY